MERIEEERNERFVRLICVYEDDILRFLYRVIGDTQAALDIKQDTMEKAWRAFDSLKNEGCAKSWLYRIAKNEANQYYRKNGSNQDKYALSDGEILSIESYSDGKDIVIEELLRDYQLSTLEKCLQVLDEKYRNLMQMRYLEDMSTK